MKTFILLFLSLSLGHAQKEMPDRFRHLNGQNYYEYLSSNPSDDLDTIRERFIAEMKKWHGVDKERAQLVNEAYDALKKPEVRERYDLWLRGQGNSRTGSDGAHNSSTHSNRGRESSYYQNRADVIHHIFRDIENHLRTRGTPADPRHLAEIAKNAIVYNQRFMPGASFELNDFYSILMEWCLPLHRSRLWSEWTYRAATLGAIKLLKERFLYDEKLFRFYKTVLLQIQRNIREANSYEWQLYFDEIHQFGEGVSYLSQWAGPDHGGRKMSCQDGFQTYAEVRDAYGNVWRIPINIKIGF